MEEWRPILPPIMTVHEGLNSSAVVCEAAAVVCLFFFLLYQASFILLET